MVNDEAIAWAEYATPDELPTIHHRKQYLAEADLTPAYRITCLFVDKRTAVRDTPRWPWPEHSI